MTTKAGKANQKTSKKPKKSTGNRPAYKWTPQKTAEFLRIVVDLGGNVTHALRAVELSNGGYWDRRDKYPEFAEACDKAVRRGRQLLLDEAQRRAFDGVDEPIVYQGQIMKDKAGNELTVKKYSDYLMGLMLKANFKEFKERHEITGKDGTPIGGSKVVVYVPDNGKEPDANGD